MGGEGEGEGWRGGGVRRGQSEGRVPRGAGSMGPHQGGCKVCSNFLENKKCHLPLAFAFDIYTHRF